MRRVVVTICFIVITLAMTIIFSHGGIDCEERVIRDGPKDLTHWSWRTIDRRQCWYKGARMKPKHELRWSKRENSTSGVEQPAGVLMTPEPGGAASIDEPLPPAAETNEFDLRWKGEPLR